MELCGSIAYTPSPHILPLPHHSGSLKRCTQIPQGTESKRPETRHPTPSTGRGVWVRTTLHPPAPPPRIQHIHTHTYTCINTLNPGQHSAASSASVYAEGVTAISPKGMIHLPDMERNCSRGESSAGCQGLSAGQRDTSRVTGFDEALHHTHNDRFHRFYFCLPLVLWVKMPLQGALVAHWIRAVAFVGFKSNLRPFACMSPLSPLPFL